jgi:DNA-binding NarL/FixJ family response regulator
MAKKSRRPRSTRQPDGEGFSLSPEERSLVALLVAGYTKREMARHLALSESTIYRHTVRVFGKLGAANRLELVLVAIFHRISEAA